MPASPASASPDGALQFARLLRQRLHAPVVGVYISETWQFGVVPEGTAWTPRMHYAK